MMDEFDFYHLDDEEKQRAWQIVPQEDDPGLTIGDQTIRFSELYNIFRNVNPNESQEKDLLQDDTGSPIPVDVKEEPEDDADAAGDSSTIFTFDDSAYSDMSPWDPDNQTVPMTPTSPPLPTTVIDVTASTSSRIRPVKKILAKSSKIAQPDKQSHEYRERRRRNNVAVRKSRDKAKDKQRSAVGKLKALEVENEALRQICDKQDKEIQLLKKLFVATSPSCRPT